MKFFASILLTALVVVFLSKYVPGITIDSLQSAIVAGLVLNVAHSVIKPILLIVTLPVTLLTLGLFVFVINATLFYLAASFVPGFEVTNFTAAFLGALGLSIAQTMVLRWL